MTPDQHIDAFIDAFVHRHYRPRMHLKHREFLNDLCHALPSRLDTRCVIPLLPALKTIESVIGFVRGLTPSTTACFLGSWSGYEMDDYPLEDTLVMVENVTGSATSNEPGELVFYRPEYTGEGEKYLLVKDPVRRQAIMRHLSPPARTKQGRKL